MSDRDDERADAERAYFIEIRDRLVRDKRVAELNAEKDKRIAELEAENAELRADAERYRWLREQVQRAELVIAEVGGWDELESWSGDDPDGMIDLAMSQRAEQQDGRE